MLSRWTLLGAAVALAAPLAGCAHEHEAKPHDWYVGSATVTSATTGLDDAQIVEVLRAALTAAADESKMASEHAQYPAVRELAAKMDLDYSRALGGTLALLRRDAVTPKISPTSDSIVASSRTSMRDLQARQGSDFDRAFVAREVRLQQALLDRIDLELLPAAQHADLRSELLRVRPVVSARLEDARKLQNWLLTQP